MLFPKYLGFITFYAVDNTVIEAGLQLALTRGLIIATEKTRFVIPRMKHEGIFPSTPHINFRDI